MPRAVDPAPPQGARRRAARALSLALAVGLAAPAAAQHPMVAQTRAAHARLAAADVVAVATVEQVSEGRIRLGDARVLYGELAPRFQVKRSPASPPPLAAGDRALLLLRGARPPYVLVDRPDETIRLADPGAEARWVEAFEGWLRLREHPAAWPALYAGWIERGPDTLRDLAVDSLGDPKAPFQPLPAAFAARLGDEAWDAARPLPVRRAAASVAQRTAPGATRLAAGFASAAGEPDPALSVAAITLAALLAGPDRDAAFLRGLGHPDAEVRRAVLRALEGGGTAPGPAVRERVARLTQDDPESWLRAEAERVLAGLPAPAPAAP
jgi:hypothetical protein